MTASTTSFAPPATLGGTAARLLDMAGRIPDSVLALAARGALAGVFFRSGLAKTDNWELTVQLFAEEYQVPLLPPEAAAWLATAAELACPAFLVAGLATRLATLPLLAMTLVIQLLVYPVNWPEHLGWAVMLLLLLSRGPGAWSLDHLFSRLFPATEGGRHGTAR